MVLRMQLQVQCGKPQVYLCKNKDVTPGANRGTLSPGQSGTRPGTTEKVR